MKLLRRRKVPDEYTWVSFEETETYKDYIARKRQNKATKEERDMEVEVHNKLDINYSKTLSAISFFAKSALGKFTKKNDWKLEVWLEEKSTKKYPTFSCGVALMRPNKGTIYAKKASTNLNEALKRSVSVLEKSIRRENAKWDKNTNFQYTS